jgi:predicted negative regulator of RcsB-dependent stress response
MDNSTQYDDELVRYMDGEMKETEKEEMEKKIAADKEMQAAMARLQLAREAVKTYGLKEKVAAMRRQMIDSGSSQSTTETPVRKMDNLRRIIRYSVAVAASVLLVFLGIEGYNFYQLSPNKLFAETYLVYELTTTRDAATPESGIEKEYRAKNFAEVIKLNGNTVLSVKDIFLTGMAYLETGDLARAISNFQLVLVDLKDNDTTELKEVTEYYLALALLKNRDYDQAIELMNKIKDDPANLYNSKFTGKYINRVKRLKWR